MARHDRHRHPAVGAGDIPAIKTVIHSTGLFPSDFLDGMAEPFLTGTD